MKLYIKNMVCDRCRVAVESVVNEMGLMAQDVQLGEVDFGEQTLDQDTLNHFEQRIVALGFELVSDKKSRLIERIKVSLIALVRDEDKLQHVQVSTYLGDALHHDYSHLSHLFSSVEGMTIEQYFILQKIERAKELLVYDELTLTQIAEQLAYSSVSHLSNQFKKVTGLSPSHFRQLRDSKQRQPLDKI